MEPLSWIVFFFVFGFGQLLKRDSKIYNSRLLCINILITRYKQLTFDRFETMPMSIIKINVFFVSVFFAFGFYVYLFFADILSNVYVYVDKI